jgi:hypothetical protein
MYAGRSDERALDIDGGGHLQSELRPFRSWSTESLESEHDRTAAWLKARLVTFGNSWDPPPVQPNLLPDFRELWTVIRLVSREARWLEFLSDELRLRRRWSMEGQARARVDENWRIHRTGDDARVKRVE